MTLTGPPEQKPLAPPASILSKAFDVLGAFGPDRRVLTLTEIARGSDLPKSTVHRLIVRLCALGVLEPHGPGFRVGLPMRRLGSAMPIESLRQSALPHLGSLHHWAHRHVHLAALRGNRVVFVERMMVPGNDFPSADPGTDLPAHATALGKALLAHIPEEEARTALRAPLVALTDRTIVDPDGLAEELRGVRKDQVALARGESHPQVTCVAAPVLIRGRAVAAVSVSTSAHDAQVSRALRDAVRMTAVRISRDNQKVLADGHEIWFPGPV